MRQNSASKNQIIISQPIHISNHKTGFYFDSPSHDQTSYDYPIPCAEQLAFLQHENEYLGATMAASSAASSMKDSFHGYEEEAKPAADNRKPAAKPTAEDGKLAEDVKPAAYNGQLAMEDRKAVGGVPYQDNQKPLANSDAGKPFAAMDDGKPFPVLSVCA